MSSSFTLIHWWHGGLLCQATEQSKDCGVCGVRLTGNSKFPIDMNVNAPDKDKWKKMDEWINKN